MADVDDTLTLCGHRVHQAANRFPMIDAARLSDLVGDIKTNGLKVKIQLVKDGDELLIIDGRNRALACEIAGVAPQFETVICGNPYHYVWSLNGHRRDLTDIQRGVIFLSCQEGADAFDGARKEAADKKRLAMTEKAESERKTKLTDDSVVTRSVTIAQNDYANVSQNEYTKGSQTEPRKENRDNRATATIAAQAGISRATMEKAKTIVNSGSDNANAVAQGTAKPTEVLRQISHAKKLANVAALPTDKFRVIYADPPWSYNDKQGGSISDSYGAAEKHYPSMSIGELCALPIQGLTQQDAVLFLWATSPLLPDALRLCDAWGFKYKAAFIWDKVKHNMGHYNSVRHEFLLICTKGSCTPDVPKLIDSVQSIERTEKHSEKPEEFRAIIDELYPSGTRIELFRRGAAPDGWAVWGNEASEGEAA